MSAKKPTRQPRTPEEIIGKDLLIQLLFEGYVVIPQADHWFKSMIADEFKGNVSWDYQWNDGASGGFRNVPSDAAERKIIESAQAVIFHALSDGKAKLTLTATKSEPA